jgi:hypothetical protein
VISLRTGSAFLDGVSLAPSQNALVVLAMSNRIDVYRLEWMGGRQVADALEIAHDFICVTTWLYYGGGEMVGATVLQRQNVWFKELS